jgi:hypothetical protein
MLGSVDNRRLYGEQGQDRELMLPCIIPQRIYSKFPLRNTKLLKLKLNEILQEWLLTPWPAHEGGRGGEDCREMSNGVESTLTCQ